MTKNGFGKFERINSAKKTKKIEIIQKNNSCAGKNTKFNREVFQEKS